MDTVVEILNQAPMVLAAVVAILTALVSLFLLIPGEQPEKFLKGAADFLAKFSRK